MNDTLINKIYLDGEEVTLEQLRAIMKKRHNKPEWANSYIELFNIQNNMLYFTTEYANAEWEISIHNELHGDLECKCSHCGYTYVLGCGERPSKYCHHCGAKMGRRF